MATWLRVPSLAENVNEATIARWIAAEGERLDAGGAVAEMITEKAQFTFETETPGVLTARLAPERSVLPVGAVFGVLDGDGPDHDAARAENEDRIRRHAETLGFADAPAAEASAPRTAAPAGGAGLRATPAARRLAKERGVPLEEAARGLPPGALVREEHVRAAAERLASGGEAP